MARHSKGKAFLPHEFRNTVEFLGQAPRVLVSRGAYERMRLYVEIADQEVGWLGTADRLPGGDILVDGVMLFKQEVTPTETEISADGLAEFATELMCQGQEGIDTWNRIRFWGHSHVNMGTSPSGTDERTMEQFRSGGHGWFLRGIFNKAGRAEFTLFLYETGVKIVDLPWEIHEPVDSGLRAEVAADFAAKVVERKFHHFGVGSGLGGTERSFHGNSHLVTSQNSGPVLALPDRNGRKARKKAVGGSND